MLHSNKLMQHVIYRSVDALKCGCGCRQCHLGMHVARYSRKCGGVDENAGTLLKDELLVRVAEAVHPPGRKITIVGAGQVGMAIAFNCMTRNLCSELCLIDVNYDKLKGQMMDLQHGSCFLNNAKVTGGADYAESKGSSLCVITAGSRTDAKESYVKLIQRNANLMKEIIPKIVKYSPTAILLIVSKPIDVLTYFALKLSGFPPNRVIGAGCHLDSVRFRYMIGLRLGVSPSSCHGWIIGENGKSCVPVWSGVNIAGVCLCELKPEIGSKKDNERWYDIHRQVVRAAFEVIKLKGYSTWAIALSTVDIMNSIISNGNSIKSVSVSAKGYHCIEQDICLSLPCILNANGAMAVVQQVLTEIELEKLHKSAKRIYNLQKAIKV